MYKGFAGPLMVVLVFTYHVQAVKHLLITTNRYDPPRIHKIEFDDEQNTLRLVRSADGNNTHVWLSLSHDMKTVYGSSFENGRLSSYDVATLETTGAVDSFGACEGKNSAYNMISNNVPHFVMSGAYGTSGGCGMSLGLDGDGSLKAPGKSWTLDPKSSTHGFQFWEIDRQQLLYTADMGTDSIWTHAVDADGGVKEVGRLKFSTSKVKPRFLEIHPNGKHVYVVLEYDNSVTALPMDKSGELCENEDGAVWSLIPDDVDHEQYWSAVLAVSPDAKHLWATTRGKNDNVGYISGFKLDDEGAIVERMFRVPTNSTGTMTSSLTVARWSDEHVIYADAPGGFLAVLKLVNDKKIEGDVTAEVVARLDMGAGLCCSNALWLD